MQVRNDVVLFLLNQPQINLENTNRYGDIALHTACAHQSPKFIDILIEKGSDVNRQNEGGDTPLHIAVTAYANLHNANVLNNFIQVIRKLINNNADQSIRNTTGLDPIMKMRQMALGAHHIQTAMDEINRPIKRNNLTSSIIRSGLRTQGMKPRHGQAFDPNIASNIASYIYGGKKKKKTLKKLKKRSIKNKRKSRK